MRIQLKVTITDWTLSAIGSCGVNLDDAVGLALRLVARLGSGGIDLCSYHT